MGLLDFFSKSYIQDKRAQKYGQQFGDLVNEYQGNLGPTQMQQPSDLFLEAAAIPGYQSLAQGAQSQMGALQRQTQGQDWSADNLTRFEADRLRQTADHFNQGMAQRQTEFGTMSPYQEAQLALSERGQGIQQDQFNRTMGQRQGEFIQQQQAPGGSLGLPKPQAGYYWGQDEQGPTQRLQPGAPQFREAQDTADKMARILTNLDVYEGRIQEEGTLDVGGSAEKGKAKNAYRQIINDLGELSGAGALGDKELEFYGSGLVEPGALWDGLFTSNSTVTGATEGMREQINESLADFLTANPEIAQANPALRTLVAETMQKRERLQGLLSGD